MSNKLKCVKHDRRILATETSFLHKTGDCSPCDGMTATIGDTTVRVGTVSPFSHGSTTRKLLMDVFAEEPAFPETPGVVVEDGTAVMRFE